MQWLLSCWLACGNGRRRRLLRWSSRWPRCEGCRLAPAHHMAGLACRSYAVDRGDLGTCSLQNIGWEGLSGPTYYPDVACAEMCTRRAGCRWIFSPSGDFANDCWLLMDEPGHSGISAPCEPRLNVSAAGVASSHGCLQPSPPPAGEERVELSVPAILAGTGAVIVFGALCLWFRHWDSRRKAMLLDGAEMRAAELAAARAKSHKHEVASTASDMALAHPRPPSGASAPIPGSNGRASSLPPITIVRAPGEIGAGRDSADPAGTPKLMTEEEARRLVTITHGRTAPPPPGLTVERATYALATAVGRPVLAPVTSPAKILEP